MDSRQRRRPVVGCRLEGEQHDQALLHGLPIRSEAQGSQLVASGEDRLTRGFRCLGDPGVGFGHASIALDGGEEHDQRFVGTSLGQQGVAEP